MRNELIPDSWTTDASPGNYPGTDHMHSAGSVFNSDAAATAKVFLSTRLDASIPAGTRKITFVFACPSQPTPDEDFDLQIFVGKALPDVSPGSAPSLEPSMTSIGTMSVTITSTSGGKAILVEQTFTGPAIAAGEIVNVEIHMLPTTDAAGTEGYIMFAALEAAA